MVGVSGRSRQRFMPVAASARSLPAFTCGTAVSLNMSWIWPPSRSFSAGPVPL